MFVKYFLSENNISSVGNIKRNICYDDNDGVFFDVEFVGVEMEFLFDKWDFDMIVWDKFCLVVI